MNAGGLGGGIILKKPTDPKAIGAAIQHCLAAAGEATPRSPFLQASDRIRGLDPLAPDTPARCRAIVWWLISHSRVHLAEFAELVELAKAGVRDPSALAARIAVLDQTPAIQDPSVRNLLDCIAASRERDTTRLAAACHPKHETFLSTLRTGTGIDARYWIRMARVYRGFRSMRSGEHLGYVAELAGFADENQLSRICHDVLGATVTEIRASVHLAM